MHSRRLPAPGRNVRSSLLICLLLVFICLGAASAAYAETKGEELVQQFVSDVRSMSGRFEQSLVDADDEVVETSEGTFEILRPGRFRWSYTEPYEQVLVADGVNVWSYDVDLAQVTVKPQSEVLGSTPASLLGGSDRVLDDFRVVGTDEDRGTIWVRLEPNDTETGFETVDLGFTDGVLSRMMLSDNLEQTTLVALFDVEVNGEIDPVRFRFTPPADVDVVGTPTRAATR
jgi:outer membrane lipoprotein carrier protein